MSGTALATGEGTGSIISTILFAHCLRSKMDKRYEWISSNNKTNVPRDESEGSLRGMPAWGRPQRQYSSGNMKCGFFCSIPFEVKCASWGKLNNFRCQVLVFEFLVRITSASPRTVSARNWKGSLKASWGSGVGRREFYLLRLPNFEPGPFTEYLSA